MARAKVLVIALAASLTGCPVDERTLLEAQESEDGSAGSAGRAGGGSGNSGNDDAGTVNPCDYVSGEEPAPDCATLINNPGFHADTEVADWQSEKSAIYLG